MDHSDWIVVPLDFAELAAGTLHAPSHTLFAVRDHVVLEVTADRWPPLDAPARHLLADLRDLGYRVRVIGSGTSRAWLPALRCDFEQAA